jgi:hypothetical protein
VYTHLLNDDERNALAKLPALPVSEWVANLTLNLTQEAVVPCQNVSFGGTTRDPGAAADVGCKPISDLYLSPAVVSCRGMEQKALVGVEPTVADLQSGADVALFSPGRMLAAGKGPGFASDASPARA